MTSEDETVLALQNGRVVFRPKELDQWELKIASKMWGYGHGTKEIARRLWTKEFRIYNNLDAVKKGD